MIKGLVKRILNNVASDGSAAALGQLTGIDAVVKQVPQRLHVLVVTEHYWPEQFRITDLAEELRERGHDVDVLTGMPNYPQGRYFDGYRPWGPTREEQAGVRVERVPIIPRGRGRAWELALNYGSYVVAASLRAAIRRRYPWDVVLVFQPSPVTTCIPALLLRALARIPVAIWVQDLWPETIAATSMVRGRRLLSMAGILSHGIYRRCDRVMGQSRAYVPRLAAAGIPEANLAYLPNWAEDLYKSRPAGGGGEQPWERGFPVMFAGNLGRVQALDTILGAAGALRDNPELRWVFVGDGPLSDWLSAEVERSGLEKRVFLLGRKPMEAMPGLFARAGAMLVSLKAGEVMSLTIPSKVQSYLAAGRPILGSLDGEGARVIEESGAGWSAPAGDVESLARNVLRMKALSRQQRDAMGRRGRVYYDNEFDRSICVDRLERVLTDMTREVRG